MNKESKPKIDIFYCVNAFEEGVFSPQDAGFSSLQAIRMACSAMIKDVYILKAFESGAEGVLVVGCPQGRCKRVDGNVRAAKRVAFVQKLLDEIGLGGTRLAYTPGERLAGAIDQLSAQIRALADLASSTAK